jgi:phosphoribosylformylglycinamidine synthase
MDAKFPGDLVYVLGETRNELGGSEYYRLMETVGLQVPRVHPDEVWPHYLALHRAIDAGLVASCHAVSRGGLGVHLAMVAMGGEVGVEIELPLVPAAYGLTPTQILYSESAGRFILTVAPEKRKQFEKIFSGMRIDRIGVLTEATSFIIRNDEGEAFLQEDTLALKDSWLGPFGDLI